MKHGLYLLTLAAAMLGLTGCTQPTVSAPQPNLVAAVPTPPKSAWMVQAPTISAMDGEKSQFLYSWSEETTPLHEQPRLVLAFDNGRLSKKHCGVSINAEGMVNPEGGEYGEYKTHVRVKFDDEKPISQTWSITDSHDALSPHGEAQFLAQMLRHRKLIVEFSYYEKSPETVTFD